MRWHSGQGGSGCRKRLKPIVSERSVAVISAQSAPLHGCRYRPLRNQRYFQEEVVGFPRPLRCTRLQHGRQILRQLDRKGLAMLAWREHDGASAWDATERSASPNCRLIGVPALVLVERTRP